MTGLLRFTLSAVLVSSVLAGVVSLFPETAEVLGVDFWNLPALERQIEESEHYSAALDARHDAAFARLAGKHRVTVELLEGRLSLLEAAVRFRDWNDRGPANPMELQSAFSGRTEVERVCQQVISWVAGEIEPKQAETACASLKRELQQLMAEGKTVSWPDR